MNKYLSILLIIVIALAVFFLERDYMFIREFADTSSAITLSIGVILGTSAISVLFSKNKHFKFGLSRRFTILMIIIYIISLLFAAIHPFVARNTYFFIILPLFLYYFPFKVSYEQSNVIIIWSMTIVFVLLALNYFINYSQNILYDVEKQHSGSYSVLYILPFLLCHKRLVLRWLAIAVAFFVIMISLKRGGFIAVVAAVAVFFLISISMTKGKKIRIGQVIVIIGFAVAIFYLVVYINGIVLGDLLVDRLNEMEESEGSGRLEIYSRYLNYIGSDDMFHWIFGHGWEGSIRDSGVKVTCHNDFLEIFIDFGIIGFVAYIFFWLSLIKLCMKMIHDKHDYAPAMGASIAIFFVNSMVAHIFIYSWYMILFALFWGFIVTSYYYGQTNQD